MTAPPALWLLLAAHPQAPGAFALLERAEAARAGGARVHLLLAGEGLAWTRDERLARLAAQPRFDVALCSRSVRDQGVDPDTLPGWARWSSLVSWLLTHEAGGPLWGCLP